MWDKNQTEEWVSQEPKVLKKKKSMRKTVPEKTFFFFLFFSFVNNGHYMKTCKVNIPKWTQVKNKSTVQYSTVQ